MRKIFFNDEIVISKIDLECNKMEDFLVVRDGLGDMHRNLVNSWGKKRITRGLFNCGDEKLILQVNYGKDYVNIAIIDFNGNVPLLLSYDASVMEEFGEVGGKPIAYLIKGRERDFEYLESFAINLMLSIMYLKKKMIF